MSAWKADALPLGHTRILFAFSLAGIEKFLKLSVNKMQKLMLFLGFEIISEALIEVNEYAHLKVFLYNNGSNIRIDH